MLHPNFVKILKPASSFTVTAKSPTLTAKKTSKKSMFHALRNRTVDDMDKTLFFQITDF
jgi:hypothetical protein